MKKCTQCSYVTEDNNQIFCGVCGSRLEYADNGQYQNPQQNYYQAPNSGYYTPPVSAQPQPKMKWFKFLIYFALFFGGIVNIASGVTYLTGTIWETMGVALSGELGFSEEVYEMYEGLRAVDIVTGIATIAMGVFGFVARFKLSAYKKEGPRYVGYLYLISAIIGIAYSVGISIVTGVSVFDISNMGSSVVMSVAMYGINKSYFDKRKHLFIN